jgi:hypothetical protein
VIVDCTTTFEHQGRSYGLHFDFATFYVLATKHQLPIRQLHDGLTARDVRVMWLALQEGLEGYRRVDPSSHAAPWTAAETQQLLCELGLLEVGATLIEAIARSCIRPKPSEEAAASAEGKAQPT